jgi:hypothetical protein
MKEISCIHAEGYPAVDMKHGPIASLPGVIPLLAYYLAVQPGGNVRSPAQPGKIGHSGVNQAAAASGIRVPLVDQKYCMPT